MTKAAPALEPRQQLGVKTIVSWAAAAVLVVLALRFFLLNALHYLVDFSEQSYAVYWPNRTYLLVHIIGGSIALLAGPFQIWSGLRRRVMKWHRAIGTAYLSGVTIGSLGAFYMAWISPLRSFGIALLVLAFVWVLTTAMAYLAIRNRQFDTHKEWMLRSYVVTYGFSIFRLLDELQFFQSLGNERFATIAWVCWTIPLMMTEVGLQWKRTMAR